MADPRPKGGKKEAGPNVFVNLPGTGKAMSNKKTARERGQCRRNIFKYEFNSMAGRIKGIKGIKGEEGKGGSRG